MSSATTRTIVHFYPSAGSVTAPYAANCKLTIFGDNVEAQSITLEGARLSYPDGIRLEDIFVSLREGVSSSFGVIIEVSSIQPRVDLSGSQCVVELASKGQSVRFHAKRYTEPLRNPLENKDLAEDVEAAKESLPREVLPILGISDSFSDSSFVVANGSDEPWTPEVSNCSGDTVQGTFTEVAPGSVVEFALDEKSFSDNSNQATSWGEVSKGTLYITNSPNDSIAMYACYRDRKTKRQVAVSTL